MKDADVFAASCTNTGLILEVLDVVTAAASMYHVVHPVWLGAGQGSPRGFDQAVQVCSFVNILWFPRRPVQTGSYVFMYDHREAIAVCPDHADALANLGAALFKQVCECMHKHDHSLRS